MNGKEIIDRYNDQCWKLDGFVSLESIIDQALDQARGEAVTDVIMFDKLFITEILNDLHRHGFVGGKSKDLLHDWAKELKQKSRVFFPASRLKKVFCEVVGIQNW